MDEDAPDPPVFVLDFVRHGVAVYFGGAAADGVGAVGDVVHAEAVVESGEATAPVAVWLRFFDLRTLSDQIKYVGSATG